MQLILRNPLDREIAKTPGTALASCCSRADKLNLSDRPRPPAAPRPRPGAPLRPVNPRLRRRAPKKEAPFVMEILSGNKKTEAEIRRQQSGG